MNTRNRRLSLAVSVGLLGSLLLFGCAQNATTGQESMVTQTLVSMAPAGAERPTSIEAIGHVCGGIRYWTDASTGRTWQQAREHCQSLGGDLASVHSESASVCVNQVLAHANVTGVGAWLGMREVDQEGAWRWSDGSAMDYQRWLAGEPNDDSRSAGDCGHAWSQNAYQWNDIPCGRTDLSFVCQLP
ncbi:MAG: C-type lectin domain-containing protein [Deltaproteobacteria bacterium]|nr:C-type lectin domain-containing protein [Deltaproteobacteria bacterium]